MKVGKAKPAAKRKASVYEFNNEWHDCLPLTKEQLSRVEKELHLSFPDELRMLFLTCNGGTPVKPYYANERIEVGLGVLLPIAPPKGVRRESYEAEYKRWVKAGLPSNLIPFAYDAGNAGLFCVDATSGKVIYFVHDEPEQPTKEVAASLDEFLCNMEVRPY